MAEFDWNSTGDEIILRSVVSKPTYTFNWSVENFSKLSERNSIVCPRFYLSSEQGFYVTLEKCNDSKLMITFIHCSESSIKIKHTISITNYSGTVFYEDIVHYSYGKNCSQVEIPRFSTPELVKFLSASKRDTLIIKCVMEWEEVYTERLSCKNRGKPGSSPNHLPALSEDLKAAYNASLYADVRLKVGDTIVRVHKLVLCARSSVFARMFQTPMDEKKENVINITDLNPEVLKHMVSYLYTDVLVNDDFESVYALYYAADKYDVTSLRKTCSDVLRSKVDVENVCRVLALADRHSDVEFKHCLLRFIRFYIDKILETEGFNDLATPLQNEVKALRDK